MKGFVVGDIHGCWDEFQALVEGPLSRGQKIWSVGDLVDRGPASDKVLEWFIDARERGIADFVLGNHEDKFIRWLQGRPIKIGHGLDLTIKQVTASPVFARIKEYFLSMSFCKTLRVSDDTIIVHAALKQKGTDYDRSAALYGITTGATDEQGFPVRLDWAQGYSGTDRVVHGHVVVREPRIVGKVINIDTGCVFGGRLTGLDLETGELVAIAAKRAYSERVGWSD